jgi:hypothetical protein
VADRHNSFFDASVLVTESMTRYGNLSGVTSFFILTALSLYMGLCCRPLGDPEFFRNRSCLSR